VETLAIAGRALTNNRWAPGRPASRQYLLRGKIRCGDCGLMYVGSVSHVAAGEKRYLRCGGSTQWRKLGRSKCASASLSADQLEAVVWEDVRAFIRAPEVAIAQLKAQRAPVDSTLGQRLAEVEGQLEELARRERNLLRVAAEATQLDVQSLDAILGEIRTSEASLKAYGVSLRGRLQAGEALDEELFGVATRLGALKDRIDEANFEERRLAVRQLVKGIEIRTKAVDGKRIPHVAITYHFEDLGLADVSPFGLFTYGQDRTGMGSWPRPA
jgi:site-specific DNA recombinase